MQRDVHSFQSPGQFVRIIDDLDGNRVESFPEVEIKRLGSGQDRLGCGAQQRRHPVVPVQLAHGEHARTQVFRWKTLGLVKNNHRVDHVMELTAATGPTSE